MIPKFRGLSIDENSKGEWQYGHLIEDRGRAFIINEVVEANEQYITIGSWCPVNIESVGCFTGMFDKNLREIYEKDVFGTKDGLLNGIIEYREDLGMFVKEGAVEKIRQKRQGQFYDQFIATLIEEAHKLNMSTDEIIKLIDRGYDNESTSN